MIKNFSIGYLNAWKVNINQSTYFVTPAHNLVYQVNNNWKISHLIRNDDINGWKINKKFINTNNILYDLAWKRIECNGLSLHSFDQDDIIKCNFYFYQPYDYLGNKTNDNILGCIDAFIYQSPTIIFFESVNIGFRGISGSCVINSDKFVGLFIRRCTNLGIDSKASTLNTEMNGVSRGLIMTHYIISSIIEEDDFIDIKKFN